MKTVSGILREAADTYDTHSKVYGDSFHKVGEVMNVLFPHGISIDGAEEFKRAHIFDWMVGKLVRIVASDFTSSDSAHDLAVYSIIMEKIISDKRNDQLGLHDFDESNPWRQEAPDTA